MVLEILNKPTIKPQANQVLTVKYIPEREYTSINCDVDVITLGIALSALTSKFNEALDELDDEVLANEICSKITRVVQSNERDTNRNNKRSGSCKYGKDDGCNS